MFVYHLHHPFSPQRHMKRQAITMEFWLAESSISGALKTKQQLSEQQMKGEKQLVFLP